MVNNFYELFICYDLALGCSNYSRVHSKFEFQVRYFFPFRKRKKLVKLHRLSSCNGLLICYDYGLAAKP